MTRTYRIASIAFISCLICGFVARTAPASERFIDPSRGISFEVPEGFVVDEEAGEYIVRLHGKNSGSIAMRWRDGALPNIRKAVEGEIATEHGAARLTSSEETVIGGRKGVLMAFESASDSSSHFAGAHYLLPERSGILDISCRSPAGDFLKTFFACRNLAATTEMKTPDERFRGADPAEDEIIGGAAMPSRKLLAELRAKFAADPGNVSLAADLALARALYSYFDGRGRCPGVAEEALSIASVAMKKGAKKHALLLGRAAGLLKGEPPGDGKNSFAVFGDAFGGDRSLAAFVRARQFLDEGRVETARTILKSLAGKKGGHFAALALARLDLERGDATSAREWLARAEGASSMGRALRLRAARLEGDSRTVDEYAREPGDRLCGTGGAIVAHELGLIAAPRSAARAEGFFLRAIEADPSYVPAYLALGRLSLDRGDGADASLARLKNLLAGAPETPEIAGFRKKLGAWAQRGGQKTP